MKNYPEAIEVEARKQVERYRIMSDGAPKVPMPRCTMTDEDIELWLYQWLKEREFLLSDYVRAVAREHGISKGRLRAARRNLGVKTWHWVDEKDHPGYWFWELP